MLLILRLCIDDNHFNFRRRILKLDSLFSSTSNMALLTVVLLYPSTPAYLVILNPTLQHTISFCSRNAYFSNSSIPSSRRTNTVGSLNLFENVPEATGPPAVRSRLKNFSRSVKVLAVLSVY